MHQHHHHRRDHRDQRRPRFASVAVALAAAAAGLAATGCGLGDGPGAGPAEAAPDRAAAARSATVRVDAGEHWFRAPRRVRSGPTTFVFRNTGEETHQLAIARLAPGVSAERAIAARGEGGTAVPLGEVVARPGVTGELHADLKPGRHVLLCFEGDDDGRPHLELGQRAMLVAE